tara:strand:+ start:663 stop:920 length:258 start_codon:yes stop_codon:yes gene_type:complete
VLAEGGSGIVLPWTDQEAMLAQPVKQPVSPYPDPETMQIILQQMIEFARPQAGHAPSQAHDAIIERRKMFLVLSPTLQELVNRLP